MEISVDEEMKVFMEASVAEETEDSVDKAVTEM